MIKDPQFKKVRFGDLRPWSENPKVIREERLHYLADLMVTLGLFKNFTCWEDPENPGSYITGGGSHRWLAAKHILKWPGNKMVWISINYPSSEAEKLFLSLVDNMEFAQYEDQKLAEMAFANKEELEELNFDLDKLDVNLGRRTPIERVIKTFGPDAEDQGSNDQDQVSGRGKEKGQEVKCPHCGWIFNTKEGEG